MGRNRHHCQKNGLYVFVEVKTLAFRSLPYYYNNNLKPEDQMTQRKIEHLKRSVLFYLNKKKIEGDYRCDLIAIQLFLPNKKYRLRHYQSIF